MVAALTLLCREVGWSVLPGLAVVGAVLRVNRALAARTFARQQQLIGARDERAKLMREVLGGIKAIKLQAWELAFAKRVQTARASELTLMRHVAWLRSLLAALFSSTPTLVAVAMLGMHTLRGFPLTLQSAMAVLATVNLLRSPLVFLPSVLQSMQAPAPPLGDVLSCACDRS